MIKISKKNLFHLNNNLVVLNFINIFIILLFSFKESSQISIEALDEKNYLFYPHVLNFINNFLLNFQDNQILYLILFSLTAIIFFYLLLGIFNKFLDKNISFILALLSFYTFNNINFHEFLLNPFIDQSFNQLIFFKDPLNSIILIYCAALFFLIFEKIKNIFLITILITFGLFLSFQNVFFIMVFWITLILSSYFLTPNKNLSAKKITLAFFILFFPLLYYLNNINNLGNEENIPLKFNQFHYFIVYFITPLFLIIFTLFSRKIDYVDFLKRFWQIYIILLIEVIFIMITLFSNVKFNIENFYNSTLHFILHFLYFLPIIYYQSQKPYQYKHGIESYSIMYLTNKYLWIMIQVLNNKIIFNLIIIIIFIYALKGY
jgi:hypothetical protein